MFQRVDFLRAGPLAGVTDVGELDRAEDIYLGDRCGVVSIKLYEGQPPGRVYFRCRVRWNSVRVYTLRESEIDESRGGPSILRPMRDLTDQVTPAEIDRICRHLYYCGGYGRGRFLDEHGHHEGETTCES